MTEKPTLLRTFVGNGRVEAVANDQILMITSDNPTPEHVAAWYDTLLSIIKSWDAPRPILLLYDLTWGPTTPSQRGRIMELRAMSMTLPVSIFAAIVTREEHRRDFQLFANLTGAGTNHLLRLFSKHDDALRWLRMQLP